MPHMYGRVHWQTCSAGGNTGIDRLVQFKFDSDSDFEVKTLGHYSNLIDVPSQDTLDNHMWGKDHIKREKQLQEQRKEKALKRQRYDMHNKGIPVPPKAKRYIGENNCCSQKFSLWRMLTEHMVSDHEINSSCSQCWKQCSSRAELKSHVAFIQFAGFNRLRVGEDTAELRIK